MRTLETKLALLKQDLRSKSEKLKHEKRIWERKQINNRFFKSSKQVYRSMKGNNFIVEKVPENEAVEKLWKDVLQNEASFNNKAEWLEQLEKTYCRNVSATNYNVDRKTLDKVIKKIQINNGPGRDLINGYWYKNLVSYRDQLSVLFNQQIHLDSPLPPWLSTAHTVWLPKSTETHIAKNYRPIACINVMYKLSSSCINQCVMDQVYKNNIVTPEQAVGKKRVWETVEQLLIKKSILKEVRLMRRNLVTFRQDYRQTFDSVPHSWLLHALKLAISVSQQRSRKKQITSQFEGYLVAFKTRKYQQNSWFIKDN